MMLAAYFDESGIHSGCPALTVAGWLSTELQWKKFQKEWDDALQDAGLTYFHMTDYENRQGSYKHWTNPKREAVLKTLHKIIRKRAIIPVSASVPIQLYKDIRQNYAKPNSPYIFCVHQCLLQLEVWARENRDNRNVKYVFERGSGFGNDLSGLFQHLMKDPIKKHRFRLASWQFGDKRMLTPLQAADLLAYESNKEMLNFIVPGTDIRPIRKSALNLVKGNNMHCVHFGKDALNSAMQKLFGAK
jgi:hypothetical protein